MYNNIYPLLSRDVDETLKQMQNLILILDKLYFKIRMFEKNC